MPGAKHATSTGDQDFGRPIGGWTRDANLGTEDVSFEDSISPEFYELEREAVFRRSWLNIGFEYQLPHPGSYFTKELPVIKTSILVTRGTDGQVRAFHNMCSHRGNKLVWDENPREEVCGNARQFVCKYHGWRFGLAGELSHVNMEEWFFDLDKCNYGLVPVHCDTWNGFIFINASPEPVETLREYLGELGEGLEAYPFEKMTQPYWFEADINSNWKLFEDAFQEQYHPTTLHHRLLDPRAQGPIPGAATSYFKLFGKHSLWSQASPPFDESLGDAAVRPLRPMETLANASLFGPWDAPDVGITELPKYVNPLRHERWTSDLYHFYPNMEILVWHTNWWLVYTYWPTGVNTHTWNARLHFVPPKNASHRIAQEHTLVEFKEFALQDANLLEATQSMLESRVRSRFPLNDEEVQLRNNHMRVQEAVRAYQAELAGQNGVSS